MREEEECLRYLQLGRIRIVCVVRTQPRIRGT